jgi:quercetin dioxygenase-like cupin family protein
LQYPFSEERSGPNKKIRTFSSRVEEEELVWHRDREDRVVKVLESSGWFLQLDNELPLELLAGDVHVIPKNVWHRVVRKKLCDDLRVEITAQFERAEE